MTTKTLISLIVTLFIFTNTAFSVDDAVEEINSVTLAEAQEVVWAFESSLSLGNHEENAEIVGNFFTTLDSTPLKIKALGMLDSRYVYSVDRETAGKLVGPFIRDSDLRVRTRAARVIGYNGCGASYSSELIAMLDNDKTAEELENVFYAMGRSDHAPFAEHLTKFTVHSDPKIRSLSSRELTQLTAEDSFEVNKRLLKDAEYEVRAEATQNLAFSVSYKGDLRGQALVEQMLEDTHPHVRERAVWGIGIMKNKLAADQVAELLEDENSLVRGRAARVLGELESTEHVESVTKLLSDENISVRRYALIALGNMGDKAAVETLQPFLKDEDKQIRDYAEESIRQLQKQ